MKKKIFLSLVLFLFAGNLFAQSGWEIQEGHTNATLLSIFFINQNTGWICGDSGVSLKTTNGGLNWDMQSYSGTTHRKIFFTDTNNGWIVGGRVIYPWGVDRIMKRTTNGGTNWILSISSSTSPLSALYFIDSLTGFIGSGDGGIYKTTDGGISFSALLTVPAVRTIFFSDSQFGYFGGDPYIYKTENGGDNWTQIYYSGPSNVVSLFFVNYLTGFATGHNTILKTTNFGENWVSYPIQDYFSRKSVFFSDPQHGIIVGNTDYPNYHPLLERTTNGGINWVRQSIQIAYPLYGAYFINNNIGWICGGNGTILKTTNGGVSVNSISTNIPDKFSLSQNYPNPFNPGTVIRYQLSVAGFTTIKVFDLLGKEVASLVNEKQNAGSYAVDFNSSEFNLPSGIYFYTLNAGEFKETRKMVLVK